MKEKYSLILIIIFTLTCVYLLERVYTFIIKCPDNIVNNLLPILSCLSVILVILMIFFINKKYHLVIPKSIYIPFVVFCFCSIILGDVRDFYGKFPYWDNILHFSSGVLLGMFSFVIMKVLNKSNNISFMSPLFIVVFCFCFVMGIESLWEIFEYLCDDILKTNMQTYMLTTTSSFCNDMDIPLVGHEALKDTMFDFMCNAGGALLVSIISFIKIRKENMCH